MDFVLAPDRSGARHLRRQLARRGARWNVVVGTWVELVERARSTYLVAAPDTGWDKAVAQGAIEVEEAFWIQSLDSVPRETAQAIGGTLAGLLESRPPGAGIEPDGEGVLGNRARRNLSHLAALATAVGDSLPPALARIRDLLQAPSADAMGSMRVHCIDGIPALTPWQRALIDRLSADAGDAGDPRLDEEIDEVLESTLSGGPRAAADTALGHLQRELFSFSPRKIPLDDTLQCLAVRDEMEELEVAAGIIQRGLRDAPDLTPADFALLLPADPSYRSAAHSVFEWAGLPLAGLQRDYRTRDLGAEVVHDFLLHARGATPAMLNASLLASPLMPWDREQGLALAQDAIGGRREPGAPGDLSASGRAMLEILRSRPGDGDGLARSLTSLIDQLRPASPEFESHLDRARDCASTALSFLAGGETAAWDDALRAVTPQPELCSHELELPLEGVAIFDEDQEPWRPCRHLIVVGCSADRYPRVPAASAVFSEDDLKGLRRDLGYAVDGREQVLLQRRQRLLRQLALASDRIDFLVPRRDGRGQSLGVSSSLIFMARLFEGVEEASQLILDLDDEKDRAGARLVVVAPATTATPPRAIESPDLQLGLDLLERWRDADGSPRPLSPSSLDTLMVSPLAWVLDRAGIEPREWNVETLDPATRGTLAHDAFEHLFPADVEAAGPDEIRNQTGPLLDAAIARRAPFAASTAWHVERMNLVREIRDAALEWRRLLDALGGRVVATERRLRGRLDSLPITGFVDALIALPDGALYVTDYKKSSAGSRRRRMQTGFDSQASLYRRMIETGGPEDEEIRGILQDSARGAGIGILYFTMNDATALTDRAFTPAQDIPGLEEMGSGISDAAMVLIAERLRSLGRGEVPLNRDGDEDLFSRRRGVGTYALDATPLIRLFTRADDPDVEERA